MTGERTAEPMSELGSNSEVGGPCHEVRFARESGHRQTSRSGQKSAKTGLMRRSKKTLFDHLIRARKQRRRNGDAKRFGGLEIHD